MLSDAGGLQCKAPVFVMHVYLCAELLLGASCICRCTPVQGLKDSLDTFVMHSRSTLITLVIHFGEQGCLA